MLVTYDRPAVEHFAAELAQRVEQCGNGEGMTCATLEGQLTHFAALCDELGQESRGWRLAVFQGFIPFQPETEACLRRTAQSLLAAGKRLVNKAHGQCAACYELEGLEPLKAKLFDLGESLDNWLTPQLAVAPGPRVRLTPGQSAVIEANLAKLFPAATAGQVGE